jgi:hypothetical protein
VLRLSDEQPGTETVADAVQVDPINEQPVAETAEEAVPIDEQPGTENVLGQSVKAPSSTEKNPFVVADPTGTFTGDKKQNDGVDEAGVPPPFSFGTNRHMTAAYLTYNWMKFDPASRPKTKFSLAQIAVLEDYGARDHKKGVNTPLSSIPPFSTYYKTITAASA